MSDETQKLEKVTISKIGRKEMPSKFREGETYTMTNILTSDGRKMTTFTDWAKGWKVGDTVEGFVQISKYKSKEGFEEESIRFIDPSTSDRKKKWSSRPTYGTPRILDAYKIAAEIAPLLYANKKAVKLDDISALADEIKKRLDAAISAERKTEAPQQEAAPAPVKKEETKTVDINDEPAEEENIDDVELEDDDGKPF